MRGLRLDCDRVYRARDAPPFLANDVQSVKHQISADPTSRAMAPWSGETTRARAPRVCTRGPLHRPRSVELRSAKRGRPQGLNEVSSAMAPDGDKRTSGSLGSVRALIHHRRDT